MVDIISLLEKLNRGLIVSCQAWPGDPLDDRESIRRIALAALDGGAVGLRINSPEHIAAIRRDVTVPIIGLQKRKENGLYRITPSYADAAALAAAGATIIALDCTARDWLQGDSWKNMIARIRTELRIPVMADVSSVEEAIEAARAGADFVGPTLYGYTGSTSGTEGFNWCLLAQILQQVSCPVIAEGHISTPAEARRAIDNGALCVVVGSAITRPGEITAKFVRAMAPAAGRATALGVDLGGTAIKAGLVHGDGRVELSVQRPTRASEGRDAVVQSLRETIEAALLQARCNSIEPWGLGIASAGVIDSDKGVVFAATGNLPDWAGFNLKQMGEEQFKLPTFVINDAQAAALAELEFGQGRKLNSFVALTLGTGVGGGIVSDGNLVLGHLGVAGSIGHLSIRSGGVRCNCGRHGCLESYVSTNALLRAYRKVTAGSPPSGRTASEDAFYIAQLAKAGDSEARKAYIQILEPLADGIANLFNILDPEMVFLSGGLVEGQDWILAQLLHRVRSLLHFGEKRNPSIRMATTGRHAGVQGAGALVFRKLG